MFLFDYDLQYMFGYWSKLSGGKYGSPRLTHKCDKKALR